MQQPAPSMLGIARSRPRQPGMGWMIGVCGLLASAASGMAESGDQQPPATATGKAQIAAEASSEDSVAQRSDTRCDQCHHFDEGFTHPIGVAPKAAPASLPLDDGRMTCLTCHDERATQAHDRDAHRGEMFLRGEGSAAALCNECHDARSGGRAAAHATLSRAHLRSNERLAAALRAELASAPGTLDAESASCLACHDGSVARDVDVSVARRAAPTQGGMGTSHPLGVVQKPSNSPVGSMSLRGAPALDPRIRLFDERIGCGSCHSPYSHELRLLVMSNDHSALCLSCHID